MTEEEEEEDLNVKDRVSVNVELGKQKKGAQLRAEDEAMLNDENDELKIKLTWEDFNANFASECPPFNEIGEICSTYGEKVIDVRPYMELRPYKVFESESIKIVHQLFRHMDLRSLPVLKDRD